MSDLAPNPHTEALIANLCMLVKRMARRLDRHKENVEDHKLADVAINFLRVNNRLGSVLREVEVDDD